MTRSNFACAALAALVLGGMAAAQDRAVRCGTLFVGSGSDESVLRDVWLVIADGKIQSIGKTAPPAGVPVVDASDKVVMPGIVAVDSDLSGAADSEYQVTPDALAIDAFDFERKLREQLEGGVTTVYLSPGRARLVSGQGAVVKTAGDDLVARVLADRASLRIDFGDSAVRAPRVFEPNPFPTSDEPLQPSRIQTPTARISLLPELRALFAEAATLGDAPGGEGLAEDRYDASALREVAARKLAMRAAATRSYDIRNALELQRELGCRMVLEDPQQIAPLAATAAAQKVAATFRVPLRFGLPNPGGEDRQQETLEPEPDAPAKAAAAGMLVGLCPAAGVPARDYLMAVALAVHAGLPRQAALDAIGRSAAAILGVEDRVGTLAAGRDADFVILSGDPLAIGTMVESTWIDGERVFERESKPTRAVLAVRCGRILDATGVVYRDGVLLAQDGRIKGVGEELAIPYGAEVIDLPDGVMTPGFVDAFSHLGLAGDGMPVPPGAPNQRLDEAVDHADPMFAPALAEGLTTVLVSGKDRGPVSGRVAALKTGAADHRAMVVSKIAGLRVVHDAIGPDAIKPLRDQIAAGKAYVKKWQDYEKALAEWESGKAKAEDKAETANDKADEKATEGKPDEPAPAAVDPVTGTWEAEIDIRGQIRIKVTMNLVHRAGKVTGNVTIGFGNQEMPARDITVGTFDKGKLTLEFEGRRDGAEAKVEATVTGETMTGKLGLGRMGDQDFTAKRTSKAAPKTAPPAVAAGKPKDEDKPKPPPVDDNLEPMRAVLGKQAALVVACKRATAITDVIELLEKEEVPYVLDGADDLVDDGELARDKRPPVIVGPVVVEEDDDGELIDTPAVLADRGLPVLFGSGECAGARYLPLHAAYAVRYGLSPADALKALTIWPARAFKLDGRIGSLEKGKDADFTVFSGNPFEPQSRVLLVVCNGKVVVDNRSKQ
ncbi:MAG: amidohydrolase family protein [Planctomycetes bacterium]|nr:amidohydrolase family protein [Planctomycetota bacterium]